jgi:hypothetical protein
MPELMFIEAKITFRVFEKISLIEKTSIQINGQAPRDCRPRSSLPKPSAATHTDDGF